MTLGFAVRTLRTQAGCHGGNEFVFGRSDGEE